jgi:DNA mismatch repair protein MutS
VAELAGLPRPVINRAQEILAQLESDARQAREASALPVRQLALFPETNPLLESLRGLDVASLTPLEALNKLYEWQVTFLPDDGKGEPSGEASH